MGRQVIIPLLIIIGVVSSKCVFAVSDRPFRLIALDVGEGQSILIQTGARGILVDTGHAGKALSVIEKLRTYGVSQLDYLILTHLHPDHASGYFRIREAFPDTPVLVHGHSFITTGAPDISRWVAHALEADPHRRQLRAGNRFIWRDVTVKTLWPGDLPGKNMNDSSLVLEIGYGSQKALLMGDAGINVERQLLEKKLLSGSYDVLVAGHHGSKKTSSTEFLKTVAPAYSLVSINVDNIRGYPDPETIERLQRHSRSMLLKTYDDGDICLQWMSRLGPPVLCTKQ